MAQTADMYFLHTVSIIIFFELGYDIAHVRYFITHKQTKVIIKRCKYTLFVILSNGERNINDTKTYRRFHLSLKEVCTNVCLLGLLGGPPYLIIWRGEISAALLEGRNKVRFFGSAEKCPQLKLTAI